MLFALLGISFFILLVSLLGNYLTIQHLRTPAISYCRRPAISILKPLKGCGPDLYDNLESFFKLDYHPAFELLFSMESPQDPAANIVHSLVLKYPKVQVRIFNCARQVGINPKVNNMMEAYEAASYDYVLISDDSVCAPFDYLTRLVLNIRPGVGIVTALVSGKSAKGFVGKLEAMHLNSYYPKGMVLAHILGHPTVMGKTMLFRRSAAEEFGGLEELSSYVAEDYMAGIKFREIDLDTVIADIPTVEYMGYSSFKSYWSRHVRWNRIRKAHAPFVFLAEFLFNPMISGLIGAWAYSALCHFPMEVFITFYVGIWLLGDALMFRLMGSPLNFQNVGFWIIRELLAIPMWFYSLFGRSVHWRGRDFVVAEGGLGTVSTIR